MPRAIDARWFTVVLAMLWCCTSCESENAGPANISDGSIDRIAVTPPTAVVASQGQQQFEASARGADGSELDVGSFTWTTSNNAIATVSETGLATGVAPGSVTVRATAAGKSGEASLTVTSGAPSGLVVDVYGNATYQTMNGWEGVTQIGQQECDRTAYPLYHNELIDRLVNELGINRVRLEVRSGGENPNDWFTSFYITKQIPYEQYRTRRYEIINDNADPFSINPSGFRFTELDNSVDDIVTPMRQKLAARGERLYVNLNYVDFGTSAFEHSSDPNEYAEYMLAIFQHLRAKYGWSPDAIEMVLEPDNTPNWSANAIGAAIVATGDRLKAAGFGPDFIAPANTNASSAVQYFDAMMQNPRVREYLTEFSYHRYSGVTQQVLQSIGQRAAQWGVRTAMLEEIGATHNTLYEDITVAGVSSWQQFALGACSPDDNPGLYYDVNVTTPTAPRVTLGSRGKMLRQYFYYVRLGAVRVGAASGSESLAPLAFRNPNGKFVVVTRTDRGTSFQVRFLPAGTYGITYTTPSQFNGSLPDVTIGAGGTVPVSIPAAGVVTVFRR